MEKKVLPGVPIIDISSLVSNGDEGNNNNNNSTTVESTIKAIGEACREWGFFYAVGHGVDLDLISRFKKQSKAFFEKPIEFKKNRFSREGYLDYEFTKQRLDWKEGFDFSAYNGSLENKGPLGENKWPEGMPGFKDTMYEYFESLHNLSRELLRGIWKSLNADLSVAEKAFDNVHSSIVRLNFYAKCPKPQDHLCVGPHADPGALTVLLQDDGVDSLQVQQNNQWYHVPPVPNSFVINIGDMIQVWSNGLYQAAVHRVVTSETTERYSAPFFYNPSYAADVAPLQGCISEERPLRYKPINWGEFRRKRFDGNVADLGLEVQIWQYEIKPEQ